MMGTKKEIPGDSDLRQRAEKELGFEPNTPEELLEMSSESMATLIHELQVHQIELKMQNQELRRLHDELEKARDKYSHLYDFAPIGYFALSEKGVIVEANLTFATMLGYDRGNLIKKPLSPFVLKEDQDIFYKHRQQLLETGMLQVCELRLVTSQGGCFSARFESIVIKTKAEDSKQIRVTVSDISELKQINGALRESEEKYRSMMNSMKDPACICSPGFRIEYMNPAMINRIGRDAVGEICYKAIYGRDEKCSWCSFDLIERQQSVEYEWVDLENNRCYSIGSSPIVRADSTVSKLTVFRDITEIKVIEEKLRQSLKMESIGALSGGIAHDFNNILGIIIGNTELAMADIPEWNPAYSSLEEIKIASLRAKNVVRQLLDFSRKNEQNLKPLELGVVVKDSLKFLRSTIPATINIQQSIDDMVGTVLADPTQINQIMLNLCINASHAMEQSGGTLRVTMQTIVLDVDTVEEYPELNTGEHVEIQISDTGIGMEPKISDRIFDPYFTTKNVGKGSGTGLAVVQGIVKSHNSAIRVQSELGRGTTFTILFPIVEKETPPAEIKRKEDIKSGTESILFVDDEIPIAKLVKRMLERLGYTVEVATNPITALELFKSKPDRFDLVISDMTMPHMTGVMLSEKIKELRPHIPIIICSGYSSLINEESAKLLGIADYVMKPIVSKEMAKIIRDVLDEAKNSAH